MPRCQLHGRPQGRLRALGVTRRSALQLVRTDGDRAADHHRRRTRAEYLATD